MGAYERMRREPDIHLRRPGEFWPQDVRSRGTNEAQQAMDMLLATWAERTWQVTSSRGVTFAMRVAQHMMSHKEADPQAEWKRSANGKERRVRTTGKGTRTQQILGEIAGRLLMDEPRQYALLCLHYGAFQYVDTIHWPLVRKASYLGIAEGTYRNRLSKLRAYFIEHWPKSDILR